MTDSLSASSRRILQGDLLDFTDDPGFAAPQESPGVRWRPGHRVLIDAGRITAVLHRAGRLSDAQAATLLPGGTLG